VLAGRVALLHVVRALSRLARAVELFTDRSLPQPVYLLHFLENPLALLLCPLIHNSLLYIYIYNITAKKHLQHLSFGIRNFPVLHPL